MGKKRLLLIGGGGHCRSILDSVISQKEFDEIGIIDSGNATIFGISVVGTDADLPSLFENGWNYAFVSVGSIGETNTRRKLYSLIRSVGFNVPSIIDSSSIVSKTVDISDGVFIGKGAVVNCGTKLGCCSIVNSSSTIEHDCEIGDFAHIAPGSILCGQVSVGVDTHIGAGTVVRQCLFIGNRTIIGAGSVVVNSVPDGVMAYGNPCRIV